MLDERERSLQDRREGLDQQQARIRHESPESQARISREIETSLARIESSRRLLDRTEAALRRSELALDCDQDDAARQQAAVDREVQDSQNDRSDRS